MEVCHIFKVYYPEITTRLKYQIMMQKRIFSICMALSMFVLISDSFAQRDKSEISGGFGYYSIYSMVNRGNGYPFNASGGSWTLNYRYYLTKNVTLGLGVGAENISTWGSFVTIAPELTVAYLDTRQSTVRVRLYGSVSYGVTIFNNTTLKPDQVDNSGVWASGFQATPFGIRIGRQFAYYCEVGVGYKGLINTGVCLRFPRILARNRHHIDD